jgi:hypothetical protein
VNHFCKAVLYGCAECLIAQHWRFPGSGAVYKGSAAGQQSKVEQREIAGCARCAAFVQRVDINASGGRRWRGHLCLAANVSQDHTYRRLTSAYF